MESNNIENKVKVQRKINIIGIIITIILLSVAAYGVVKVYNNKEIVNTVEAATDGFYIECKITRINNNVIVVKDEGNHYRFCKVKDPSIYEVGQEVRFILSSEQKNLTLKSEMDIQIKQLFEGFLTTAISIIAWILLVGLTDWAALIHEYEEDEEYAS